MAGSLKAKKGKAGAEKKKGSPKTKEKKGTDDLAVKIDDLKSVILEDDQWQSVVVIVVVENQKLYDGLLQEIIDLPEMFTVITPTNLGTGQKTHPGGESKTRKRSTSKGSKKTTKTKDTEVKKSSKKDKQNDQISGDDSDCTTTCILLKRYILELKNADIIGNENKEKTEQNEKLNKIVINDHEGYEKLENCRKPLSKSQEKSLIQRYIFLWGFYNPNILNECSNFNILVKAIITIKEKSTFQKALVKPDLTSVTGKKQKCKRSVDQQAQEPCSTFIEKLHGYMKDIKFLEINKDVLFLNYVVKELDNERKKAQSCFESNILKILYGIREAWEKFSKYIECLQLQEIPEVQETLTLDDANIYLTMASMIPPECTTVPIIIHCMLEQISWWDEHIFSKIVDTSKSKDFSIDRNSISKNITDSQKTSLSSEVTEKNITPILIDERDEIRHNTFHLHLPEINFQKITMDLLLCSPVYRLWLNYPLNSLSRSKWYGLHLQRFKKCAKSCYFDSDKLFNLYLHQSVMNVLVSKPDKLSIRKDDYILGNEESDTYLIATDIETDDNGSITSFVQGIICNILCRVTNNYLSYASLTESSAYSMKSSFEEIEESMNSKLSVLSKWYEIKTPQSYQNGCLLNEKLANRQEELNKLKSFLLCSEFVNLYEDVREYGRHEETDYLRRYEFVKNLNVISMCQSLQNAYENFVNANYYYFPPTDTILLWFNNCSERELTFSRTIKGVLETPLGFRDFYKYKLGGMTNFEEMAENESIVRSISHLSEDENFSGSFSLHQELYSSHESHTKVDEFLPKIVSVLGPSRIEHSESYEYFFSPDSTSVTVKKTKYFSDQMNISVFINKNNTSLYFDFFPEAHNSVIKVRMKMHNDIMVHSHLSWIQSTAVLDEMTNPDFQVAGDRFSISSDLSVVLPSGLLIEVVATESNIGPFYIRQRYLLKGPTCGKIWEENYRCYLKNGTVLIFNSDSTVYILYSNGTMVKCNSFAWEKSVEENVIIKDEIAQKENDLEDDKSKKTKKGISDKGKKGGKGKNEKKKTDKAQENISSNKKKKDQKMLNLLTTEDNDVNIEKYNGEHEIYLYKIIEHSVLSWDGSCKEYVKENCKNNSKIHNLRMAFHNISQELYFQRSDGMTSLFTPQKLSVLFPDGSKITSYSDASKELNLGSGQLIAVEDLITRPESIKETDLPSKGSESDSFSVYSKKTSSSQSNESQNNKDPILDEENFVYVETCYLFEHNNYATVKYMNGDCEAEIVLPGNIVIHLDKDRMFTIDSGGNEKITLSDNKLFFEAQVMEKSMQHAITRLDFKNTGTRPTVSCQTMDSLCNVFSINEKGHTTIVKNTSENCGCNTVSLSPLHSENVERFFVLNRDLTGCEMIQNLKNYNESKEETIITPIIKNNDNLFNVYTQTPIYKNKSEQYLMSYMEENNLPTLIKRKDLLKLEDMPENIWFQSHLRNINIESKSEENLKRSKKLPPAMSISKYFRMKSNIDLSNWFSMAINRYMSMNENIFNKYLSHYPDEIINEKTYAEGESHKQQILGSQSYYLTDNLPKLVLGDVLNDEANISIHSVSASASSKVASLLDMLKQIKQNN